jgi:hypothetical protein
MTPDEEALELLELHEDAESIHAVVWGPGLEKRAPAAEDVVTKMRTNGLRTRES